MARRKKTDDDQPKDSSENLSQSDDTFGLPEIEYEPINRDATPEETPSEQSGSTEQESRTEQPAEEPKPYFEDTPRYEDSRTQYSSYSYSHETETPMWPRALLIVLGIVILVGGGLWYFMYYKPKRDEEKRSAAAELAKSQEAFRRDKAKQDSLKLIEDARQKRIADSLAAIALKPAVGTIEMLSGRTGKYYVVVASDIDDDLLMDYAKKLSTQGVSSKIIPPHGKVRFFRLTIAEGETYATAQSTADGLKSEYNDKLWVTKY
jgi:hypothetical protein